MILCFELVWLIACRADLPPPSGHLGSGGGAPGDISFSIEPEAPLDAAPRALRLRVGGPGALEIDPGSLVFVEGELGEYQLRDLEDGDLSKTLTERLLPLTAFAEAGFVIAIPHAPLSPGVSYALGFPGLERALTVSVDPDAAPALTRVSAGGEGSAHALFCGEGEIDSFEAVEVGLDPGGPAGELLHGSPAGFAQSCVRFEPNAADGTSGAFHAPVAPLPGVLLAQAPIAIGEGAPDPIDVVACEPGEIPFGPGCATVYDDRVRVRAPEAPLLWVVGASGVDAVAVTHEGSSFVVHGLEPSADVSLSVELCTGEGWRAEQVEVHTLPPQAHFVINEVLANAVGEEPEQEWVEIINNGSVAGLLDGVALEDIGGHTPIPPGAGFLEPGGFAVLVGIDFDETSRYDELPASSALLVRALTGLGKNGLSNSGEPLRLVNPEGSVLSRFPSEPKPNKAGKSVARRAPDALDDDPEAFSISDPATPGLPNAQ